MKLPVAIAFLLIFLKVGIAGAATQWSTDTGWGHHHLIFPSEVIALATIEHSNSPFFVHISNVPPGTRVKIVVSCHSLFADTTKIFTTHRLVKQLTANVNVNWRFNRLDRVKQQIPADVTYTLYENGHKIGTRTDTALVHSINACPYLIREKSKGKTISLNLKILFAAYVNENAPILDSILKRALKTRMVNAFEGYQAKTATGVIRQVCAIWLALESQGIKYSDIAKPPQKLTGIFYQHVRFVDQSYAAAQANCVDGTVLFASLLEHIGIDCGLVIKPGHMFLLYYAAPDHKDPLCLETTMLGARSAINPHLINPVQKAFHWWELRAHPFEAATQEGDLEYNTMVALQKKFVANKQPGDAKTRVGEVIFISRIRGLGINPLPDPYFKNHDDR